MAIHDTPIMTIEFDVQGEPFSKQRPRAYIRGGHAHVYTPTATHEYEWNVRKSFEEALDRPLGPRDMLLPIKITIEAHFGLLKGDYTSKGQLTKNAKRKLDGIIHPTTKKDVDNIAKAVLDGLNKTAFRDDAQVVSLTVEKSFAPTGFVHVRIDYLPLY